MGVLYRNYSSAGRGTVKVTVTICCLLFLTITNSAVSPTQYDAIKEESVLGDVITVPSTLMKMSFI